MRSKDPFLNKDGGEHKDEEKRLPVDVFYFEFLTDIKFLAMCG